MTTVKLILIVLLIGVINAFVYVSLEWIVNAGTNFIWNGLFNTDTIRWIVIPLAILLSIAFSSLLKLLNQKRVVPVVTDLVNEATVKQTNLRTVVIIFVVGAASLLAGASLGPEATLVGVSIGIGVLFAQKSGNINDAKLYALSSAGALFVAFFGSLIPLVIPVFLIYKKVKKLVPRLIIPPLISGVAAYLTLLAIKGHAVGYGTINVASDYKLLDIGTAFILGIFGVFIAVLLKSLIKKFGIVTQQLDAKFHWILSASIFGAVLGLLYFWGGQPVQFSGSEGIHEFSQTYATYTAFSIILLIITKILATSWSLASGFRGGLVFPSVFIGDALGHLVETLNKDLTGPGIILGSISGILTAMTSPFLGFIIILSIAPLQLLLVALAGMSGAILGNKLIAISPINK